MTAVQQLQRFGGAVTLSEVERLLADQPHGPASPPDLRVDLSEVRYVEPGAGVRLGIALSRWSAGGVTVVVPDERTFSDRWFRAFTRSGIGLSMARYARVERPSGEDVTAHVRAYYEERGNESGGNYAIETAVYDGALVPSVDVFSKHLSEFGKHVRLDPRMLPTEDRRALVTLLFEALQNVFDHAYLSPWEGDARGRLSYFSMRWHGAASGPDGPHGLGPYLKRAAARLGPDEELEGWNELVVADDGVGIAARQSQDAGVYEGPIADEEAALVDALSTSASVKLRTRDTVVRGQPGFGTTLMADAAARLNAHVSLRTGRKHVALDGTLADPGFVLDEGELGYLPGSIVHVVLPRPSAQLRF